MAQFAFMMINIESKHGLKILILVRYTLYPFRIFKKTVIKTHTKVA